MEIIEQGPEILIPKKNIIFDATLFSALVGCPRYAELRMDKLLVPIEGKSNSLECGSLVHNILEHFFKARRDGKSYAEAQKLGYDAGWKYIKEGDEGLGLINTPADSTKEPSRIGYNYVFETMEKYFIHYKNDSWIPIDVEHVKGKVIYEDSDLRILWKAKLDLSVDMSNGIFPVDHKTMQQDRKQNDMSHQFMGQCVVMDVSTVFINKIGFQSSLPPEKKFQRVGISYSKGRLIEFTQVVVPYYANLLISYQEMGFYPPRFSNCDGKYGFCMYHKICSEDPSLRNKMVQDHYKIGKPWDVTNED